jgi:ferredoxin
MPYVITEDCIRCKWMDCVEVCPVDCFHEGANMLVIHPEGCIDCGVCEAECPEQAILPGTDPRAEEWRPLNAEYASQWPVIYKRGPVPADADEFHEVADKHARFFDPAPGRR